jgi:hypothetical protein
MYIGKPTKTIENEPAPIKIDPIKIPEKVPARVK